MNLGSTYRGQRDIEVDIDLAPGVYWADNKKHSGLVVDLEVALGTLSDAAWDLGLIWDGYLIFDRESNLTVVAFAENPEWALPLVGGRSVSEIAEYNRRLRKELFPAEYMRPGAGAKEKARYRVFRKLRPGDVVMLRDVGTEYTGAYEITSLDPLQGRSLGDGTIVQFQQQQFDDIFDPEQIVSY